VAFLSWCGFPPTGFYPGGDPLVTDPWMDDKEPIERIKESLQ